MAKDIQAGYALGNCLIFWSLETGLSHQNTEVNNKIDPHTSYGKKIPLELFSIKLLKALQDEDILFISTLINNHGFDTNVKHPRRFCDISFLDEVEQNKNKYPDF